MLNHTNGVFESLNITNLVKATQFYLPKIKPTRTDAATNEKRW